MSCFTKDVPSRGARSWCWKGDLAVKGLIRAAKGLPYETIAVWKKVGANLSTGARERMEGVEIYMAGQKSDDAVGVN